MSHIKMKGRGAPRNTVFGVIGDTMNEASYNRSLGGLVKDTKTGGGNKSGTMMKSLDKPSKTKIPGAHYAQVPYPGRFMAVVGKAL